MLTLETRETRPTGVSGSTTLEGAVATDDWLPNGRADWDTPDDWSAGLPTASSDVVIDPNSYLGGPDVTASFGTVTSLTIGASSDLAFADAGANSVGRDATNNGYVILDSASRDGGTSLMIGGTITIGGQMRIGGSTLAAASTIEAASVANVSGTTIGEIELAGSSTAEATLDLGSAAGFGVAGALTGDVNLSGEPLIEFSCGQITTIAADGELTSAGKDAFVADASNTRANSALAGLDTIDQEGGLVLQDGASVTTSGPMSNQGYIDFDEASGAGGSVLTIDGALSNSGFIDVDLISGDGGSLLGINGALSNSGYIAIGPTDNTLSTTSTFEATSVVNSGTINLYGGHHVHVTLGSAGTFANDGTVSLWHDHEKIGGAVSGTGEFDLFDHSVLDRRIPHGFRDREEVRRKRDDLPLPERARTFARGR